jgi:hypothetical protein
MLHIICNMEQTFSSSDLAKILEKPLRFVIDWAEQGLFVADIQPASGHASRREFSYTSLLRAALALALQNFFSIKREFIHQVLKILDYRSFFQDWASKSFEKRAFLLVSNPHNEDDASWVFLPLGNEVSFQYVESWIDNTECALLINISNLKKSLDKKISNLE